MPQRAPPGPGRECDPRARVRSSRGGKVMPFPPTRAVDSPSYCLTALRHCLKIKGNDREREKFIIRQPPTREKDDYDGENSWTSDGLPSSSRRRRRVDRRGEGGEWREK